jgi:hypothetical protein
LLKTREITKEQAISVLAQSGCEINVFVSDAEQLENALNFIERYADAYFSTTENNMELRTELAQVVLDKLRINHRTEKIE